MLQINCNSIIDMYSNKLMVDDSKLVDGTVFDKTRTLLKIKEETWICTEVD